jgi:hypothetical protein
MGDEVLAWLRKVAIFACLFLLTLLEPRMKVQAQGIPRQKLVAVLELSGQTKRVSLEEMQYLSDIVRKTAVDALDPNRFVVMTRESMDVIIPPEKRVCLNNACYAEVARQLNAHYLIGGNVKDFAGKLALTMEAYDGRGVLLGSELGEADDVKQLLSLVRQLAPKLLRRVLGVLPPGPGPGQVTPPPAPGRVELVSDIAPELGYLRVEGQPKGASVVISGPKGFGKVETTLPYGPVQVPAGDYKVEVSAPGYDSETKKVFVPSDKTVTVEISLEMSEGILEIDGTPKGARVDVTCEKGFSKTFGLPGRLSVPRGTCTVKVTRTGYEAFEKTVTVPGGKTAQVQVTLREVSSAETGLTSSTFSGKRFVDNGDGTVTDRKYRLVWSKRDFGEMTWEEAVEYCRKNRAGLPGSGWHLPTIDELRTLIVGRPATEPGGRCQAREGCRSERDCWGGDWSASCGPCAYGSGPGPGPCYSDRAFDGPCETFWSSTRVPCKRSDGFWVFEVNFSGGCVADYSVEGFRGVRCVRKANE